AALVALELGHGVAHVAHQRVGQRQRQLEGDEDLGHLLAQLDHRLVAWAVLGVGLLELGVQRGQVLEALGDDQRVGTGRALVGAGIVVIVVVGIVVAVVVVLALRVLAV